MVPLVRATSLLLLLSTFALGNESEPDFLAIEREFKISLESGSCPQRFAIAKPPPPPRQLAFPVVKSIPSRLIVEDGKGCPATDPPMLLAWAGGFRAQEYLEALNYPRAAAGLKQNANARAFQTALQGAGGNFRSFFGFSEGERVCRSNKYLAGTFFFFNNVTTALPVALKDAAGGVRTINLRPNTPTLVVLGPKNKICVLSDNGLRPAGAVSAAAPVAETGGAAQSGAPKGTANSTNETAGAVPSSGADAAGAAPSSGTDAKVPIDSPSPADQEGAAPESSPGASSSDPVCFPALAAVELESGERVTMSDLRIGDRVRTGAASFSDVFLFTHRDAAITSTFLRLVTSSGASITLTRSHYLYANAALVAGGSVRIGDLLQLADGRQSPVAAIENVSSNGLYNPQTVDGNIVVDGVVASAYTTAVHPRVAHSALLAPVRFIHARLPASLGFLDALAGFISASAKTLARAVPDGPAALA